MMWAGLKSEQRRWAWSLTVGFRQPLFCCFVLEMLSVASSLFFVFFTKRSIDIATSSVEGSLHLSLFLVVLFSLGGLGFKAYSSWLNERVRIHLQAKLQMKVVDAQEARAYQKHRHLRSGDVQSRIQSDAEKVSSMISSTVLSSLVTLIRLLGAMIFLWSLDPVLAIVLVAVSPLFLFSKRYFRKYRTLSAKIKKEEGNFAAILQENLRLGILIQAMGIFEERKSALTRSQDMLLRKKGDQLRFSTFSQTMIRLTFAIGYLTAFLWGASQLSEGLITFGTLTAFLQLVSRVQNPTVSLMRFVPQFVDFGVSLDRVWEVTKEALQKGDEKRDQRGAVSVDSLIVENLGFKYKDNWVFKNLNFKLDRGDQIALTGATGAGKTTLIRILLKVLKPDEGAVSLSSDGELRQLSDAHRRSFAYVPQGNTLFSGTVRDNLSYGKTRAGDDAAKLNEILQVACCDFIESLPNGIDTFIGESGFGLSEGQAQRIAIARALMFDRSVFLFDEITSSLDKATSTKLMANLVEFCSRSICVFVTHDPVVEEFCGHHIKLGY